MTFLSVQLHRFDLKEQYASIPIRKVGNNMQPFFEYSKAEFNYFQHEAEK